MVLIFGIRACDGLRTTGEIAVWAVGADVSVSSVSGTSTMSESGVGVVDIRENGGSSRDGCESSGAEGDVALMVIKL